LTPGAAPDALLSGIFTVADAKRSSYGLMRRRNAAFARAAASDECFWVKTLALGRGLTTSTGCK